MVPIGALDTEPPLPPWSPPVMAPLPDLSPEDVPEPPFAAEPPLDGDAPEPPVDAGAFEPAFEYDVLEAGGAGDVAAGAVGAAAVEVGAATTVTARRAACLA